MTDNHPYPIAGRLAGTTHHLLQRVYYEDTDFSGRVYHARYLHFLERGRTDYLRCLGIDQGRLAEEDGLAFVVGHMEIDFQGPARMDDVIEVITSTAEASGARLLMAQDIRRGDRLLITAAVTVALIDSQGRPRRIPQAIRDRLAG